jgi:positive regulator of sigma E activity
VPIVITLLGMLSGVYPVLDFVFAKPLLLVGIPLPMVVSYLLVRRYYRLQDKQKLRQQS